MNNIHAYYNELAEEKGWEKMHKHHKYSIPMPCKIVDFFDRKKPHGKVPVSMAEDLIIMEWKYYMSWWSKNLNYPKWQDN